jgi:hypothetical protein
MSLPAQEMDEMAKLSGEVSVYKQKIHGGGGIMVTGMVWSLQSELAADQVAGHATARCLLGVDML